MEAGDTNRSPRLINDNDGDIDKLVGQARGRIYSVKFVSPSRPICHASPRDVSPYVYAYAYINVYVSVWCVTLREVYVCMYIYLCIHLSYITSVYLPTSLRFLRRSSPLPSTLLSYPRSFRNFFLGFYTHAPSLRKPVAVFISSRVRRVTAK